LRDAGITVDVGILEEQARKLNVGFIKRMEQGLPWVRIKLAMSLDGRTAMASGESQWITGSAARHDVQRLRAKADAILTGIGTVLEDDPSLNVRITSAELGLEDELEHQLEPKIEYQQPLRVVLDSKLQMMPQAKMLKLKGNTVIYTCADEDSTKRIESLKAVGASIIKLNAFDNKLPLKAVIKDLAHKQINEIHVEAGATLCGALLQENLVDEIVIYMAPTLMGSGARGLFNLPELTQMKDKVNLKIEDIRAVGDDWRINIQIR
jgi:diaminohydroxyphosphoribosylaminopyrimidine deaminase/5-amino-6-(5-phosphoribosylamino)uracil reductase